MKPEAQETLFIDCFIFSSSSHFVAEQNGLSGNTKGDFFKEVYTSHTKTIVITKAYFEPMSRVS